MEMIRTVAEAISSAWLIAVLLALFHGFKASIGAGISILVLGPIATTYHYFASIEDGPLKKWCGISSISFLVSFVLFFIYYMVTGK
jgi:hypothetical protein